MARTESQLTPSEILAVEELGGLSNNSVVYKDNSGVVSSVALGTSGKVLQSNGATSAPTFETAPGATQLLTATMVANASTIVIPNGGTFIVDIVGLLSATGALTITVTNPTQPFVVIFDNMTTGGFDVVLNATYTIPASLSQWYYDGSLYEEVFGVNQYVPVTRTVAGHALSSNVTLAKADVGLGNVDNTSDATKNAASVSLTNHTIDNSLNTITIGTDQSFNSKKITNLADPASAQDGATKNYVDNNSAGIKNKTQTGVNVATTTTLPANTYNNGASGVGATLTANAVGTLTIDTHQVLLNEYVLVKNEATSANNGYYKCTIEGTAGVAYVLTRDTGVDTASEFTGAYVFINTGSANLNTGWSQSLTVTTVGTDSVNFAQFSASSGVVAGTGISVTGTTVSIDTAVVPRKTDNLSVFASTTSAQLAGVLSDETGSGSAVFSNTPTITTPNLSGQATVTTEGNYHKQGLDASPMYRFVWTSTTSGDLYTLLGEFAMDCWAHNTTIDVSGNFIGRFDTGECEMWVFTESGLLKTYHAVSAVAGTVPTWVLKETHTTSTGALTLAGALSSASISTGNIATTGSVGSTGARAVKVWATDIESTNMPTVGGTSILTSLTAPQFTTIELGHASDTTLSRASAGQLAVEGVNVLMNGGALGTPSSGDLTNTTGKFWSIVPGTPVRTSNTTFTITGDYTAIFAKGMVLKWTETGTVRYGMVSIPSTYGAPNTTVTIIGNTMASIDASSLKYAMIGAEAFIANFVVAGSIGATGTDVANAYYAKEPMIVLGADLQVGTAGTTNSTTVDINKGGTTMFTTKPTLATTVATSPTPFTADTATTLALADKVTIDIDAIQTTSAVDLYVQLYLFPTRYANL